MTGENSVGELKFLGLTVGYRMKKGEGKRDNHVNQYCVHKHRSTYINNNNLFIKQSHCTTRLLLLYCIIIIISVHVVILPGGVQTFLLIKITIIIFSTWPI